MTTPASSSSATLESAASDLAAEDAVGLVPLALVLALADAEDRQQSGGERHRHLPRQRLVGLAEELAPLGVTEHDTVAPASSSIAAETSPV